MLTRPPGCPPLCLLARSPRSTGVFLHQPALPPAPAARIKIGLSSCLPTRRIHGRHPVKHLLSPPSTPLMVVFGYGHTPLPPMSPPSYPPAGPVGVVVHDITGWTRRRRICLVAYHRSSRLQAGPSPSANVVSSYRSCLHHADGWKSSLQTPQI
jgi:hypothetical protein